MEPNILLALVTVGLTAGAGALGYLFRELQNRAKPLLVITEVGGDFWRKRDQTTISEATRTVLERSTILPDLSVNARLQDVDQVQDAAQDLVQLGPAFVADIDTCIAACDAESADAMRTTLAAIFRTRLRDTWLVGLLGGEVIVPPQPNEQLPKVVESYPSDQNDGCIWIDLGAEATWFGMGFNKFPVTKDKCLRFVRLIERLDALGLKVLLRSARAALDREIAIAKDIEPGLKLLLNEHSQWELQVYLANLGRHPFLVHTDAVLRVADETGAQFFEETYMVTRLVSDDGETVRNDADQPMIVAPGSGVSMSFFTKRTQEQMDRGTAFREAFKSGKGRVQVELTIEKPGLRRYRFVVSPDVPFVQGGVKPSVIPRPSNRRWLLSRIGQ